MKKLGQSTILNIGSLATFIALPLLYSATYSGNALALWSGFTFTGIGMIAPFIALKAGQ